MTVNIPNFDDHHGRKLCEVPIPLTDVSNRMESLYAFLIKLMNIVMKLHIYLY
jgi:hypothetical protein